MFDELFRVLAYVLFWGLIVTFFGILSVYLVLCKLLNERVNLRLLFFPFLAFLAGASVIYFGGNTLAGFAIGMGGTVVVAKAMEASLRRLNPDS